MKRWKTVLFCTVLLLLQAAPTVTAQGALALMERARLVVEGRILGGKPSGTPPTLFFRVSRVLKGPSAPGKIRVLSVYRISSHMRPLPGRDFLLFLVPLPSGRAGIRIYTVLQQPLAATSLNDPGGREFSLHVRKLSLLLHSPAGLARELLHALRSSPPLLVRSAAFDMEAHPSLLHLLGPEDGKAVMARLLELGTSGPWAEPLVHALGVIRPEGWVEGVLEILRSPGGAYLAPAAGQILGNVEGRRSVEILERLLEGPSPRPALILALGATGRPEAIPILRNLLRGERTFSPALSALIFHRTWRAVEVLREELASSGKALRKGADEDGGSRRRCLALLRALARFGTRRARAVIDEVEKGKLAPGLSGEAARQGR